MLEKRNQNNTEIVKRNLARRYITASRSEEIIDAWIIELKEKNYIKYLSESTPKIYRNKIKDSDLEMQKTWDPFAE